MKEITSLQELTSIFDTEDYCLIYKFNPSNCSLSDRTRPLVEQRLEKNTIP